MKATLSKVPASDDNVTRRLRRRPGEPQREQKEATCKKLLAAARATFERFSYSSSSVEMIADAAGVSRTTFYRHFDGKLPIAIALFDVMGPQLQGQWKELLKLIWPVKDDDEISGEVMAKSLLLLLQFDQFLYLFTVRNWMIDRSL